MQPLFTASSDYTLKEYRRFILTIHMKVFKTPIRLSIFLALVLLIAFFTSDHSIKIGVLVGVLACPLVVFALNLVNTKKAFQDMVKLNSTHTDFEFYEDRLEASSAMGNTTMVFDQAFRIIETKTNFYIMMTKNQGAMLSKETLSPELIAFLQKKVK